MGLGVAQRGGQLHCDHAVTALEKNGQWTVAIYDMAQDVGEKRGAQVGLIFDRLLPKGYTRETFADIDEMLERLDPLLIAAAHGGGAFAEDREGGGARVGFWVADDGDAAAEAEAEVD